MFYVSYDDDFALIFWTSNNNKWPKCPCCYQTPSPDDIRAQWRNWQWRKWQWRNLQLDEYWICMNYLQVGQMWSRRRASKRSDVTRSVWTGLKPFRFRVRSRHATDRRTDRHRPSFYNTLTTEVGDITANKSCHCISTLTTTMIKHFDRGYEWFWIRKFINAALFVFLQQFQRRQFSVAALVVDHQETVARRRSSSIYFCQRIVVSVGVVNVLSSDFTTPLRSVSDHSRCNCNVVCSWAAWYADCSMTDNRKAKGEKDTTV